MSFHMQSGAAVHTHLDPLPLQQSQEALQCAATWVHDELSQGADEQSGVRSFRAVNQDRVTISGQNYHTQRLINHMRKEDECSGLSCSEGHDPPTLLECNKKNNP